MVGWVCRYISGGTTLRCLDYVVALSNILFGPLRNSVWESTIVTIEIDGALLRRELVKS